MRRREATGRDGHRHAHGMARFAALAALALAGCGGAGVGGAGLGAVGPLAYQHSNAIISAGYSESIIAPDRYRIEVKGPFNTPRERMEKIAATRAAEIGKEMNLGYFKIEGMQHGADCKKYIVGGQRGGQGAEKKQSTYAVLTADVTYSKQPLDSSYVQARSAFDQYRAELDMPQPPDLAAAPGIAPQCS